MWRCRSANILNVMGDKRVCSSKGIRLDKRSVLEEINYFSPTMLVALTSRITGSPLLKFVTLYNRGCTVDTRENVHCQLFIVRTLFSSWVSQVGRGLSHSKGTIYSGSLQSLQTLQILGPISNVLSELIVYFASSQMSHPLHANWNEYDSNLFSGILFKTHLFETNHSS